MKALAFSGQMLMHEVHLEHKSRSTSAGSSSGIAFSGQTPTHSRQNTHFASSQLTQHTACFLEYQIPMNLHSLFFQYTFEQTH